MSDDKHGHKTAIAITCHGQPLRISHATSNALIDATHNILEIPTAPIAHHLARKCLPFAGAAMRVAIENSIAPSCIVMTDRVTTNAKSRVRPPMNTHYKRVAHALTRSNGMNQPAINLVAIHPLVNNTLGLAPGKLGHRTRMVMSEALQFSSSLRRQREAVQLIAAIWFLLGQQQPTFTRQERQEACYRVLCGQLRNGSPHHIHAIDMDTTPFRRQEI